MSLCRIGMLAVGTVAVTGMLWAASAQDKKPEGKQDKPAKEEKSEKKGPMYMKADGAKYKDVAPGAHMAVIRGDPEKGAHANFTKFDAGTTHAMHTHSSELHIVVIKGAYIFKPEKGDEIRVGPGEYLSIPAGERHVSTCDAKEGVLFYEESDGKFDLVPVEKK